MLKNNIRLAWRNLLKNKQFTVLNLVGLSTGLACVVLIFLWVEDERSVDKFNINDARLYEVLKTGTDGTGEIRIDKNTQGMLASTMANDLPEVELAVPVRFDRNISVVSQGENHIKVRHEFAGTDFFKVFTYPLVDGHKKEVSGVKEVFISDLLALKLFNTTHAAGRTLDWDYKDQPLDYSGPYTIAGVFKMPPSNATNQFDMVVPFELYASKNAGGMGDVTFWGSNMVSTYVVLKKGTDIRDFNNKIKDFSQKKISTLYSDKGLLQYEGSLFARRYSDAYLYNNYVNGKQSGGRIEYVNLFSVIALFLLLIACINFMNLSTAKAAGRMKEAGIRKVIGAPRYMLIAQYMGESMLMSLFSLAVAIGFVFILLPQFRQITGKELALHADPQVLGALFSIVVVTGLVAGSYPALYLSGFKPARVLKGKIQVSANESKVRKGLMVFQFSLSVVLIIAVVVVYDQMKLIRTKDLGYNKDNIIRFSMEGRLQENPSLFLEGIKKIPGVLEAAAMQGDFLGNAGHSGGGISWKGKDPNLGIQYYGVSGDYDYIDLLGLTMVEGRPFSRNFGSDSLSVIFNQSAIAAMGIKDPVGKMVSLWGHPKQIIGVVKDFHFESLYNKVGPAFLEYSDENEKMLVKIKAGTEKETLARIDRFYTGFNQGLPFTYTFLDEDYAALYSSEERVSVLSKYFAGIALIISCLGLYGLAAFTAQKRQKEIGIRKVVGASVQQIVSLLSFDFLKLVVVAALIAFPISWWAMNQWLQGFAYRVNMGAGVFLIAGISIIMITLITVGYQAIRAAIANPVNSLRAE